MATGPDTTPQAEITNKALDIVGAKEAPKRSAAVVQMETLKQQRSAREALKSARTGYGLSEQKREGIAGRLEAADQDPAKARLKSVDGFLKGGYDSITDTAEKGKHVDDVENVLNASWMNDVMLGMSDGDRQVFAQAILRDEQFRTILNGKMQETDSRSMVPTEEQIQANIAIRKNKGDTRPLDDPSLRADANGDAAKDLQAQLKGDIDNLVGDSVVDLLNGYLDVAEEAVITNADQLDVKMREMQEANGKSVTEGITAKLNKRWNKRNPDAYDDKESGKPGTIKKDFNKFLEKGLAGILSKDELKEIEEAGLTKQYEAELGNMLLIKRLRITKGKMDVNDAYRLADAEWMGATPDERMDNLEKMVEGNARLKEIIDGGKADGWIDPGLWAKIKKAGPGAAGGMIAAVLALLALPVAAGAPLMTAAGIGGAYVGGRVLNSHQEAA